MTNHQNIIERIKDKLSQGLIDADEANIQMVEDLRFKVIKNSLDRKTRTALNNAVKSGRLGRLKKEGFKPEVYYKTNFKHLAISERNQIERNSLNALKGVFA